MKPKNASTVVKVMSEDSKVKDALSAEANARMELEDRFGKNKILKITVSRVELLNAQSGEAWEIEGNIVLKGFMGKNAKHFKYRMDTESGRIIGFEIIDLLDR